MPCTVVSLDALWLNTDMIFIWIIARKTEHDREH